MVRSVNDCDVRKSPKIVRRLSGSVNLKSVMFLAFMEGIIIFTVRENLLSIISDHKINNKSYVL
jgi:hypothetical protein